MKVSRPIFFLFLVLVFVLANIFSFKLKWCRHRQNLKSLILADIHKPQKWVQHLSKFKLAERVQIHIVWICIQYTVSYMLYVCLRRLPFWFTNITMFSIVIVAASKTFTVFIELKIMWNYRIKCAGVWVCLFDRKTTQLMLLMSRLVNIVLGFGC